MRTRIIYNKLLGGWFIVRGPHQTPIGGRFETRAAALDRLHNPPRLAERPAPPQRRRPVIA